MRSLPRKRGGSERSRRAAIVALLTAPLALSLGSCGQNGEGSSTSVGSERPNLLLISIDSLRADTLGCYGHETLTGKPVSPRLDALASSSVVFDRAVSTTSWTMPSHHALFSGLPDLLHGAIDDVHGPSLDRVVLARELREAGYSTAGIYSGPYLHPAFGFDEGFEQYTNATGRSMAYDQEESERDLAESEAQFHQEISAHAVSDGALDFLEQRTGDRPFFLFLHYFDVHYDYTPPVETYARQFWPESGLPPISGTGFVGNPRIHAGMAPQALAGVRTYYEGEINWVDEQIGRVLTALAEQGLDENTVVCVVSDHGDEFFEHGRKGHRQNLYESTLHVPWILRLPERSTELRVSTPVSLADVAPTLLDLAGVVPETRIENPLLQNGMYGRSVLPLLNGAARSGPEPLGHLHRTDPNELAGLWAVWTGELKVIVQGDWEREGEVERLVGVRGEVFDLESDPEEQVALDPDRDARARAAIARYNELHKEVALLADQLAAGPMPAADLAERAAVQSRLVAAGYVVPERVGELPDPLAFPRESE